MGLGVQFSQAFEQKRFLDVTGPQWVTESIRDSNPGRSTSPADLSITPSTMSTHNTSPDLPSSPPAMTPSFPDKIFDSCWLLGLKFICVDDDFSSTPAVASAYTQLPKSGEIYTLNEVHVGIDHERQLAYSGNFIEVPPIERKSGLWLSRFRPISGNHISDFNLRPDPARPCTLVMCALESFNPLGPEEAFLGSIIYSRLNAPVRLYRNIIA